MVGRCVPLLFILHATRYDPRGAKQDPLVKELLLLSGTCCWWAPFHCPHPFAWLHHFVRAGLKLTIVWSHHDQKLLPLVQSQSFFLSLPFYAALSVQLPA
jgi:hypothetical protein